MVMLSLIIGGLVLCQYAGVSEGGERSPSRVDLRRNFDRWRLALKSQAPRGTCSVFAVTAAIEYALARHRRRGLQLSEEFLNWAANDAHPGRQSDGGFFHELWAGFEKHGICALREMPYAQAYNPRRRPSCAALERGRAILAVGLKWRWIKEWDVTTGLTDDHIRQIRAVLASGYPVCAGMRWPKAPVWADGVLQMTAPDQVFDGHSVLLVGYVDKRDEQGGGVFLIRNSQDGGAYQAIPYEYVAAYTNDAGWVSGP